MLKTNMYMCLKGEIKCSKKMRGGRNLTSFFLCFVPQAKVGAYKLELNCFSLLSQIA